MTETTPMITTVSSPGRNDRPTAFGMGIDRPDIEAVVHANLPSLIDASCQEIGWAGREGRPATATLLWH